MATHSGANGTVYWDSGEVTPTEAWTIDDSISTDAYHANDSGAAKKRIGGVEDSTGTFRVSSKPTFTKGATGTFFGWTGTGGTSYQVDAIIQRVATAVDIMEGTRSLWDVTFEGNGPVTTGSDSAPA